MTATGVLLILIGLFVIVNTTNFVGVLQGNKQINSGVGKDTEGGDFSGGSSGSTTTNTTPDGKTTTGGSAGGGF